MASANAGGGVAGLGSLIIPIAFLAIFYFLAIRPQRKREKQIREMRGNLKVGDEVITIGGIHGKITKIKDEILTIEVGSDKTKMDITKWAVGSLATNGKPADQDK
ncbi:preprotein translocase subunit YajC [Schnuerera sp. xch1]|uniref:preprotein translocase subunit YajC n=1 Tax=Schnuerera sp. xch1 TaxID=2874283 RepID=UPI001CBE7A55|nr:preprotein translocase subunit YajC [Schnuerera sp. xch1]MBZ2173972.1 preprotein translocase subunit YajC [Schnuerera sp. xch1]